MDSPPELLFINEKGPSGHQPGARVLSTKCSYTAAAASLKQQNCLLWGPHPSWTHTGYLPGMKGLGDRSLSPCAPVTWDHLHRSDQTALDSPGRRQCFVQTVAREFMIFLSGEHLPEINGKDLSSAWRREGLRELGSWSQPFTERPVGVEVWGPWHQ